MKNDFIWDEPIADEDLDKVVDGDIGYYRKGTRILHRIKGPASIWSCGTKLWLQNHMCHRLDGPAAEYSNGAKLWYYKGKYIKCSSQKEFEKLIKLKAFW